jgi:hypothetical protein
MGVYLLTERDWEGIPLVLAGLLLAAAAAALLFVSVGSGPHGGSSPQLVAQPTAGPMPRITVRGERAGEPFTAAGAAFRVASHPSSAWAVAARRLGAGADRRLVVVAVAVENLSRRHFNPALLSFLLRSRGGALIAPREAGIVGPDGLGLASGLPAGAHAEERLVFESPARLRRPVLAIQPSPSRALEVRVPLGR